MKRHPETCAARLLVKLSAYATAGASLALSSDALGAVIYTDLSLEPIAVSNGSFDLDLDHDGRMDIQFIHSATSFPQYRRFLAQANGLQSTTIVPGEESHLAGNLAAGEQIHFQDARLTDAVLHYYIYDWPSSSSQDPRFDASGDFGYGHGRGYLGVKFIISGSGFHTGWIDIENNVSAEGLTIYGYAFESVSRAPISAGAVPEPPSLVLLAAGAVGLAMMRRKRRKQKLN